MKTRTIAALAVMAALIFSTGALAASPASKGPLHLVPGSALVYPLFDSTAGAGTIICVTNTNTSRVYCPNNDHLAGDILLHFHRITSYNVCYTKLLRAANQVATAAADQSAKLQDTADERNNFV